ncbi:hypothetical protein ACA081_00075 [Candidatus Hodgkinia cicadicola]
MSKQLIARQIQLSNEFKLACIQRLSKKLTELEFKKIRLLNGVYLQLHSYMLRVAIPNGELNTKQLVALALISIKYDRGYFHMTTRQNVQFNWININNVAKITRILCKLNLWTAYTAGNCVRQITCDPTHEISLDEQDKDVTKIINEIRYQLGFNPSLSNLPRKVKICVRANIKDNVLSDFSDIGIRLSNNKAFIKVGGGLGRNPQVSLKLIKIAKSKIVCWLLEFLKVYKSLSSIQKHQSRIKYLIAKYDKNTLIRLTKNFTDIKVAMPIESIPIDHDKSIIYKKKNLIKWCNSKSFEDWYNLYTHANKQVCLRHIELNCNSNSDLSPPGDISVKDVHELITIIQKYSMDQVRLTLAHNLILPYVNNIDIVEVYKLCSSFIVHNIVCCPGLDYCTLANTRSILLAQKIILFNTLNGNCFSNLKIRISGCVNSCSQHHLFDIGIVGIFKDKSSEYYQILVGGDAPTGKRCQILCKSVPASKIPGIILWYNKTINLLKKDYSESEHLCFSRNKINIPSNIL